MSYKGAQHINILNLLYRIDACCFVFIHVTCSSSWKKENMSFIAYLWLVVNKPFILNAFVSLDQFLEMTTVAK